MTVRTTEDGALSFVQRLAKRDAVSATVSTCRAEETQVNSWYDHVLEYNLDFQVESLASEPSECCMGLLALWAP